MRSISLAALLLLTAGLPEAGAQLRSDTGFFKADWPRLSSETGAMLFPQQPDSAALPEPKSVMYKSMIIPGWGQVVNRQAWKVPIVYGLIGGLAWYSVQLNLRYHDYRAAYYNLNPNTPGDMRYGPTPSYISPSANLGSLRENRDNYRNRRDLIYVTVGLAYGLNILDAYVFAHMRSFDVSEDLSMRTRMEPVPAGHGLAVPGLTLSFELNKR